MKLHTFAYSPEWAGLRVREVVRKLLPDLGSRGSMLAIMNGLVTGREDRVLDNADMGVGEGEEIRIDLRHGIHGKGKPRHPQLHDRMKIFHDDEHVVVVSKKPGTLVSPLRDEQENDPERIRTAPLVELLKHYWKAKGMPIVNPVVVQRLDLETSGLLVLGKTLDAAKSLQIQLKPPRKLKREYLALVAGVMRKKKGIWKSYVGKGHIGLRQSIGAVQPNSGIPEGGLYAETEYEVEKEFARATLLRVRLETGRTHQIRIHCAESGHPLLGESVYTRLAEFVLDRIAKGKLGARIKDHPFEEAAQLVSEGVLKPEMPTHQPGRTALHSTRISFIHPSTRKRIEFEDPLPEDLVKFIKHALR